jgi:membrane-associated phospholipid phosphatase
LALLIGQGRRGLGRLEATALSVAAIGGALLGSSALARMLGRPRPCHRGIQPLVPCPEGGSLPSDQTAASFAAAVFLGSLRPDRRTWMRAAAATVALARVAAGVHYATDVVAGGAFGAAIGWAARRIAERRLHAHRPPGQTSRYRA